MESLSIPDIPITTSQGALFALIWFVYNRYGKYVDDGFNVLKDISVSLRVISGRKNDGGDH